MAAAGLLVVFIGSGLYGLEQQFMTFVTPERAVFFVNAAVAYLVVLAAGSSLVAAGIYRGVRSRVAAIREKGFSSLSPGWLVPFVFSQSRYRRCFWVAGLLYGSFYAVVTGVVVYQPGVDFALGGATIPSALVIPCCGSFLSTPAVSVYLTSHFGILLVPLTSLLLVSISALVGLNSSLALFAFDSRTPGAGRGAAGALAAAVGLFTGCPTCAGLFFANVLAGSGAVSLSGLIAYYEPVFLILSIPVLLLVPYLTSRSLSKVFRDGCVYLPGKGPKLP